MGKFRKKPVVIEAIQWDGTEESFKQINDFMQSPYPGVNMDYAELYIYTLEGKMTASKGDWIIKGVSGEHYPCKPDIFEKTYEAI